MKKQIYVFWTGNNTLSHNRKESLEQLIKVSGCEIILVTPQNLQSFILPTEPLHPAYEYLCLTHKADYLRTYFMNFYGGGYSDIKKTRGSWVSAFDELNNDDTKWVIGYPEELWSLTYKPYRQLAEYLIGNCAYICKPNTLFTNKWYNAMMRLMDEKFEALKESPARHPQDSYESSNGRYPIRWEEMLGDIFHRQVFQYHNNVLYTLPSCVFGVEYR